MTSPTFNDVRIKLAVVGAHLRGQPLNFQLADRHAEFVEQTTTASEYRLYALANTTPPKPGLKRVAKDGVAIEIEVWALTPDAFGTFVAAIPQPLGIGTLTLASGELVKGFICEEIAIEGAQDITSFGGWRKYLAEH
jgi:allophanate hydrolase